MESRVYHEFQPFYDNNSKVLILGSIPSVKSREIGFYYGHPKNRFWKVLSLVFEIDILDKKVFLKNYHIALWDVLKSCEIKGSSDSSIKEEIPNDIPSLLEKCNINAIFITGKTAYKYYMKYFKNIDIPVFNLSSTSPANCRISLDKLVEEYKIIKKYL